MRLRCVLLFTRIDTAPTRRPVKEQQMSTLTQHRVHIPSARTASTAGHTERPTRDWVQTATYLEFVYGFGAAPGVDLGLPKVYSKVEAGPSTAVYRQEFERGLTIANLGGETAEILLDRPYHTLYDTVVTSVTLPAYSAEVLLDDAA